MSLKNLVDHRDSYRDNLGRVDLKISKVLAPICLDIAELYGDSIDHKTHTI